MPLPPAPSELGAKLATTRTKASAREDAPRSETLEELRERIRARNPRPVEPAAAAPAEKATAPAPTKESQPAKPAEKSAKKKQKKAPVAAAKKETQRKDTPKTAAPVAKSEKTAPADVSARAAAPSDEKPVPTVPAESVYVPPPAEKKPSEAFPAADRLFAAATQGKTVVKPASHRRGRAVVREDRKKLFVLDTNVLLHDPRCLFRFAEHDVFLPMTTLEELDNHKVGTTEVARNGRSLSRTLDALLEAHAERPL